MFSLVYLLFVPSKLLRASLEARHRTLINNRYVARSRAGADLQEAVAKVVCVAKSLSAKRTRRVPTIFQDFMNGIIDDPCRQRYMQVSKVCLCI